MKRAIALASVSLFFFNNVGLGIGYEKPVVWSGKYSGLGGAATSSVSGAESLFFNPAGLGAMQGQADATLNFSPIVHKSSAPVTAPNTLTESKRGLLPVGALLASYKLAQGLGIGLGAYAGGGLAVDYGTVAMGFNTNPELKTRLQDIELAAGASYEPLPHLSLGVAWRVSLSSSELFMATVNPTAGTLTNTKLSNLAGTNFSGFRFGVQYRDGNNAWGVGATLRTSVRLKMTGTATADVSTTTATTTANLGAAEASTTLPLQAGVGGDYLVMESVRLFGQYDFTQYSANKTYDITVATVTTQVPMNWSNMHSVRVGMEFTGVQEWPIRAAYVFTSRVTPADVPGIFVAPPAAAHTVAVGTGTLLSQNVRLDGGFDYAFASGAGAPATGVTALAGNYSTSAFSVHSGLSYYF